MEIFSSFGGKMFYGPPPFIDLHTNLKYFLGFLSFFSPMAYESVLNLFQQLAMVMRQTELLYGLLDDFSKV